MHREAKQFFLKCTARPGKEAGQKPLLWPGLNSHLYSIHCCMLVNSSTNWALESDFIFSVSFCFHQWSWIPPSNPNIMRCDSRFCFFWMLLNALILGKLRTSGGWRCCIIDDAARVTFAPHTEQGKTCSWTSASPEKCLWNPLASSGLLILVCGKSRVVLEIQTSPLPPEGQSERWLRRSLLLP